MAPRPGTRVGRDLPLSDSAQNTNSALAPRRHWPQQGEGVPRPTRPHRSAPHREAREGVPGHTAQLLQSPLVSANRQERTAKHSPHTRRSSSHHPCSGQPGPTPAWPFHGIPLGHLSVPWLQTLTHRPSGARLTPQGTAFGGRLLVPTTLSLTPASPARHMGTPQTHVPRSPESAK